MIPSLTVAICTHNPRADFLGRTLVSLRSQTIGLAGWDLLVVDNASKEELSRQLDLGWHPRGRVVREMRLGLTQARLRAIAETASDVLLFIDDDNVLEAGYLGRLLSIAQEHTRIGCFGAGRLIPEFEECPAFESKPHLAMLALREVTETRWSNNPQDAFIPWGAGLAVRREVAAAYASGIERCRLRAMLGRRGLHLNSGEDDEFTWVACGLGYGKGLFVELGLIHLIDRRRLDLDYLVRLAEGHAFSHAVLRRLHGLPVAAPADESWRSVFTRMAAGRVGQALAVWRRLRKRSRLGALDRRVADARDAGVVRALRELEAAELGANPVGS
jgi:glycosyltransferase involved in cell wall biosynthesis